MTATFSASVLSLIKTIIGAGMLALPWAFGQTGLLLGSAALWLCALLQMFTCHLLSVCVSKLRSTMPAGQPCTFAVLADHSFGGNALARVAVEACIALGCFGFATSYLIVMGGLCPQIAGYMGAAEHSMMASRHFWISLIGFGILLPLCCTERLEALRFSSLVGVAGVLGVVVITCGFALGVLPLPSAPAMPITFLPSMRPPYTSIAGMTEDVPIYAFAFSCAQNLPALIDELDASLATTDSLVVIAVVTSALMYHATAWCGASAFGASVDSNLLRAFPVVAESASGKLAVLAGMLARAAIVFNVGAGFPLYMHPCRTSCSSILFGKPPSEVGFVRWAVITGGLFLSSWGIAMAVGSLDTVMAFVGSTSTMAMNYLLPALFYLALGRSAASRPGPLHPAPADSRSECLLGSGAKATAATHPIGMMLAAAAMVAACTVGMPLLVGLQVWKMAS